MCYLDEAGFAPTLPTTYSWSPVGERLEVPYEAPEGRRVVAAHAHVLEAHGSQPYGVEQILGVDDHWTLE